MEISTPLVEISCQCRDKTDKNTLTKWCITCNLPFCGICIKIHDETKTHLKAKHSFIDIKTKCSEHSEELTHYCSSHDIVCCTSCVSEKHVNCQKPLPVTESLQNVSKSMEFHEVERAFSEMTNVCNKLIENRRNNIQTLEEQTKLIVVHLENVRREMINRIHFLVDDLIGVAQHFGELQIIEINKLVNEVKGSQERLDSLQQSFTKLKENVNNLQIFIAVKQISTELNDIQEKTEIFCEHEAADETLALLHINSHFQDILSGTTLLGEIKVIRSPCAVHAGSWKYRQAQQILQNYPPVDMLSS